MRFSSKVLLLGLAAGLGALSGFQLQVSAMPAAPGFDPAAINRTLKGDRLPVLPVAVRQQRSEQPRLPDRCVEASNWRLGTIFRTEIPGRCVG
jgi:hypothetical protein